MYKPFLIICSILTLTNVGCGTNPAENKDETKACCTVPKEIQAHLDSTKNQGLKEWASFFHEFSTSLDDYEKTKSHIAFPFLYIDKEISLSDFDSEKYLETIPSKFKNICQRATSELDSELENFETNKLFKYAGDESDAFKLWIEYTPDAVKVTYINPLEETNEKSLHTLYTFKNIDSRYKLISITQ